MRVKVYNRWRTRSAIFLTTEIGGTFYVFIAP